METGDIDSSMVFSVRAFQFRVNALPKRQNLILACSRLTLYYFFSEMSMKLDCLRAQNVNCPGSIGLRDDRPNAGERETRL